MASADDLIKALELVKQAVELGELDQQLEQASGSVRKSFKKWEVLNAYSLNNCMRFFELKPIKPLSPHQQRIKSLQTQKDNVSKQLKAERNRQKIQKAQQTIKSVIYQK